MDVFETIKLKVTDASPLYRFYYKGLSGADRNNFAPYPLFDMPCSDPGELVDRIVEWKKEDDWVVLACKHESDIVGISILKRCSVRPTTGVAVHENFRRVGIATHLMTGIISVARGMGLETLFASINPVNVASIKLHKKLGFVECGRQDLRDRDDRFLRTDISIKLELRKVNK